jgi:hypothetical protein
MVKMGNGDANALSHLGTWHPKWEDHWKSLEAGGGMLVHVVVSTAAKNVHDRLCFVLDNNLPFRFVEEPKVVKFTTMTAICHKTFMR